MSFLSFRLLAPALAAAATLAAICLGNPLIISSVQAQSWPSNPITIVLGFPAGSGVDVVVRQLQPVLEQSLGTRVIVDYKPGAGGNVASEFVARAKADGYTLLFGTAATHGINAALYKKQIGRASCRERVYSSV